VHKHFGFLITKTVYRIETCALLLEIKAAYSPPQGLLQQTDGTTTVRKGKMKAVCKSIL
jgi:hypothetical protein